MSNVENLNLNNIQNNDNQQLVTKSNGREESNSVKDETFNQLKDQSENEINLLKDQTDNQLEGRTSYVYNYLFINLIVLFIMLCVWIIFWDYFSTRSIGGSNLWWIYVALGLLILTYLLAFWANIIIDCLRIDSDVNQYLFISWSSILIYNILWFGALFYIKNILLAALCALFWSFATLQIIISYYNYSPRAAWLLLPYLFLSIISLLYTLKTWMTLSTLSMLDSYFFITNSGDFWGIN